ncbi:MAG: MBL fold metallo-hydrolase [Thaumarchaeota archaeon]|nr:MBL fold metallo-hydrolase [Nitrososphaerota archaeon]
MRLEIFDGIFLVAAGRYHITNPTNCNVYLIDGGNGELGLIDAGGSIGTAGLLRNIGRLGFDVKDIRLILNTHKHWDHVGGDPIVQQVSGCKIAIHKLGVSTVEKGPWNPDPLQYHPGKHELPFYSASVDRGLEDGDSCQIGEFQFKVIHSPGHTDDSCCFLLEREGRRILFSGDTISAFGKIGVVSANTNFSAYRDSIKKISELKPDSLLPGHGVFVVRDCLEQILYLNKKLESKWADFVLSPIPFDNGGYEFRNHPEWQDSDPFADD